MVADTALGRLGTLLRTILGNAQRVNRAAHQRRDQTRAVLADVAGVQDRFDGLLARQTELGAYFRGAGERVETLQNQAEVLGHRAVAVRDHMDKLLNDEAALQQALIDVEGHARAVSNIARLARLLAINASVEAARAGEAGLGFAVVAREMQALSEQSSTRAKLIDDLIVKLAQQLASMRDRVLGTQDPMEALMSANVTVVETLATSRQSSTAARAMVEGLRKDLDRDGAEVRGLLQRLSELDDQDQAAIDGSAANQHIVREALGLIEQVGGQDSRSVA
ncbi:hypothetical protein JANAI62_05570 [Jannaschia pagri]|uniref:Methyl-accepting transducer domain-containing protein n=1 Tax=Jannaschia pagri TaxID=2829797 RepID=A0ABQ4NHM8_9RHOB|nr:MULTISPECIES: methyl-accepting chemotaxis protein [unclassified Jannaschia]GIT89959.1 hypothetical protein JANAI61_04170 [Jannaschia sp. AI_61]GIT93934.1 hypothetical protein JANAI62_05570 [Jannaschia sp. AI_62]